MPNAALIRHNDTQFQKAVIEVSPGVWSAVGYAASTQHMIEGESTVTIVDTSESIGAAKERVCRVPQAHGQAGRADHLYP